MIGAPARRADPAAVTRRDRIGSTRVLWRLADADGSRTEISRRAHELLAALVRDEQLFEWRGLERADAWSKPRPIGAPDADVSVSHSGGLILVAACVGARIGADVEAGPFTAFGSPALQRRMCTPAETAASALLDDDTRLAYLARIWTAKEAVTKATGTGMATDFRTLVVEASVDALPQPFEAHIAVLEQNAVRPEDAAPGTRTQPAIRRLTTEVTA